MRWLQALVFGAWLIAPAAAGDTAAPIAVPNSQALHLTSALNGKSYALLVHIPATPPPPNGYPVLYLLDGDAYFGTAYDLDKSRGDKLVIVAIAYPPEADKGLLRGEDLTLPVAAENRGAEFNLPVRVGGLDNFLKVVEREIKPKIAALTPIDAKHQAFFGHSFGGLAVLHALFTEPDAFETFIIASPSIWWNGRAVLADEEKFRAAVAAGTIAPRVLICAGGPARNAGADAARAAGGDPGRQAKARRLGCHRAQRRSAGGAARSRQRRRPLPRDVRRLPRSRSWPGGVRCAQPRRHLRPVGLTSPACRRRRSPPALSPWP